MGAKPVPIHVAVRLVTEPDAEAMLQATVHATPLGITARSAAVVPTGSPDSVRIDLGAAHGVLELELASDGTTCRGSLEAPRGPAGARDVAVELARVDLVEEAPARVVHAAKLSLPGASLGLRLALARGERGWCGALDVTEQGLRGLPVRVERRDATLVIDLPLPVPARIDLRLPAVADPSDAGPPTDEAFLRADALEGHFMQGTFRAAVRFERAADAGSVGPGRPQDPRPPFPYLVEEFGATHPGGHVLAGTLSTPRASALAGERGVPAVILVSGSGPHDRDATMFGHRSFAVLADAFTRAGFAVLRYDERGIGASTGSLSGVTTYDLASDVDHVFAALARHPGIDPSRIGIVGHSEGGLVGPIVAAWRSASEPPDDRVAFLVLLAGPAEACGALLVRQNRDLARAAGATPEQVDRIGEAMQGVVDAVVGGTRGAGLAAPVRRLVEAQLAARPGAAGVPISVEPLVAPAVRSFEDPWMAAFLAIDPAPALERIEVPTLALWGTRDLQVDAERNLAVVDEIAARSGAPIETRRFEGLNHLFQPARSGAVEEYAAIDVTFDAAALDAVVAWSTRAAAVDAAAGRAGIVRPAGWIAPPIVARPSGPARAPAEQGASR